MRLLIPMLPLLLCAVALAMEPIDARVSSDVMRLRSRGERRVSSVAGLTQEWIDGAAPELRVIHGEADLRLGEPLKSPRDARPQPTLGTIAPAGTRRLALKRQSPTWVCNQLTYQAEEAGGHTLEAYVSRLSPAVIVKTDADAVDVLIGTPANDLPASLAIGAADAVQTREGVAGPLPAGTKWVLLWRGRNTRTFGREDLPLLLVPFGTLKEIASIDGGGLRLQFADKGAAFAVLPVQGIARPTIDQTARWTAGLPEQVESACRWWADRAGAFPVDVVETCAYDAAADAASVNYEFRYLELASGATPIAPLPPMLALAFGQGFCQGDEPLELTFSARHTDTHTPTVFGPYTVIDGHKQSGWRLTGLKRYVDYARPALPSNEQSAPFEQRLAAEVEKIAAEKLLAPWFFQDGLFHDRLIERQLYWANPADHVGFMTDWLDLLPADLARQVGQQLAGWPSPTAVPAIGRQAGARRELYHVEPSFLELRMWYETDPPEMPPAYNLYAAERSARAEAAPASAPEAARVMQRHLQGRDWATLFWFDGPEANMAGVEMANRNFAGMLGFVRLAERNADSLPLDLGYGQLASAAAVRYAMGVYRQYLYAVGRLQMPADPAWQARMKAEWAYASLISFDCTRPIEDIQQVTVLNDTQVQTGTYFPVGDWRWSMRPYQIPFRHLAPETGLFLADHLRDECARYVKVVQEYQPNWYMTWAEATLGTEHNANHPMDAYGVFLVRAWVLGESPAKLRRYIDVPYAIRGDYLYMHKLAETARAYRRAGTP